MLWVFTSAFSTKAEGENGCVHHVDLLSTIKIIATGDHILQCDGIPGPVSASRQPATDMDREKYGTRWKMTRAYLCSTIYHLGGTFSSVKVWKEAMETLGKGREKVCVCVRVCAEPFTSGGCNVGCALILKVRFKVWSVSFGLIVFSALRALSWVPKKKGPNITLITLLSYRW